MEVKDLLVSVAALILIIIFASTFLMGNGSNIVKAVDDSFSLKNNENGIRRYSSNSGVTSTVNKITSLKEPYDQKVDLNRESILLYDEAVVVIRDHDGTTEIELIKDHQRAYHRHRGTMVLFWGNNLFRDGRIRTPRSMRRGSIGSNPSLGGGFGFGK